MRVSSRYGTVPAGVCLAHTWGCPVIMKTEPDHVAWTCSRCGVLAITPIGCEPPRRPHGGLVAEYTSELLRRETAL